MNCGATGDHFTDCQGAIGFFAGQVSQHHAASRHVRGTADHEDFVHRVPTEFRLVQHFLCRQPGPQQQVRRQAFKLGARERHLHFVAAVGTRHAGLVDLRECSLSALRRGLEHRQ